MIIIVRNVIAKSMSYTPSVWLNALVFGLNALLYNIKAMTISLWDYHIFLIKEEPVLWQEVWRQFFISCCDPKQQLYIPWLQLSYFVS